MIFKKYNEPTCYTPKGYVNRTDSTVLSQNYLHRSKSANVASDFWLLPRLPSPPVVVLLVFTRTRFSASLATGLVGTQENVYIADYFQCMGFLPLTSERCSASPRHA